MKIKYFGMFFILAFFLASCSTYRLATLHNNIKPIRTQYPNMKIVSHENNKAYEFRNNNSDTLLIVIEGSGWSSALGFEENNQFYKSGMWPYIVEEFKGECTILVLEKLNFELGKIYYFDLEIRENYTLGNLVKNYSENINTYLSENSFSKIVLIGTSEGACVLPLVYKNIQNNNKISGIASIAYGGLSLYEQIKILANTQLDLPYYLRTFYQNIDIYKNDIKQYSNSLGELGNLSYIWWNSILDYSPLDDYVDINIPVLFIHGELDIDVPVESTKYIQENIQGKLFEFLIYADADHHSFMSSKETLKDFRIKSREWINKL